MPHATIVAAIILGVPIVLTIVELLARRRARRANGDAERSRAIPRDADVAVVTLAFTASARDAIVAAASPDASTLLRETSRALLAAEPQWRYGAVQNASPPSEEDAQVVFAALVAAAREQSKGSDAPGGGPFREAERPPGAELSVVTLVVAARCDLPDVSDTGDVGIARTMLEALTELASKDTAAAELVWAPDDDRSLDEDEVLARHPELHLLSRAGDTHATHATPSARRAGSEGKAATRPATARPGPRQPGIPLSVVWGVATIVAAVALASLAAASDPDVVSGDSTSAGRWGGSRYAPQWFPASSSRSTSDAASVVGTSVVFALFGLLLVIFGLAARPRRGAYETTPETHHERDPNRRPHRRRRRH